MYQGSYYFGWMIIDDYCGILVGIINVVENLFIKWWYFLG
jgi:hypothetical protein